MAITPLPEAPQPTDSTAQFNTKAFAWVAALDTFVTQTNATAVSADASADAASVSATNAANSATASANSASDASDSADAAATSAETAAAATAAQLWVSGTTYALGALVWSPADGRIYRRIVAGAGTTDPSADATNWSQLTRVVEQSDIGTDPNQVPLNQYLGSMAYQDAENIAGDVGVGGDLSLNSGTANGVVYLNGSKVATSGSSLTFDGTNLGIGTSSPSASAILDAQSTTKGVRMPNMTTAQKNAIASPAAGLMVFDTTLSKLCVYTGVAWETVTSV